MTVTTEILTLSGLENQRELSQFRADIILGSAESDGDRRPMTLTQRQDVLVEARRLIEDFYVHLPHKRAMYAVDPVQRLRLLQRRLMTMTDAEFQYELLGIFDSLRDM